MGVGMSSETRLGFGAALIAYLIWGALPLYFRFMDGVRADEILVHRIIWAVPTGLFFIAIAANWRAFSAALTWRRMGWLSVSALLIGVNWLVYIWSVQQGRVMEASLGYYINPLINVVLGMFMFSERLRPLQWLSVVIATAGVVILTFAFGRIPWIALILCLTFAFYTAVRKQVQIDGRVGFVIETALLLPFAVIWLGWLVGNGQANVMGNEPIHVPLLMAAGPITAVPLICFAIAAKRLQMSTIGMMQYIGPTLQFLIAVFVFGEVFSHTHALAFGCIWAALVIFTFDSLRGNARARRLARAAQVS